MINLKELLNEEQIKPCETLEGPVMVLAGAGSGKTRVLTYRIANLIDKGIHPYNILAITYTNKAAQEMKNRIYEVTGISDIFISTFHSMCVRILRKHISLLGYTSNFSIYDEEDSEKLLSDIIKKIAEDDLDDKKGLVKECKMHISHAKSHGLDADGYMKWLSNQYENRYFIYQVFTEYNVQLVRNNALDFDDLLMVTIKLFKEFPHVLEEYQERFQYIHVDEFQDTNKVQYQLLKLIGMKYQNVFAVGDDDQSIYGWRGAEYENIQKFMKEFYGCQLFKLERNYRSTKKILEIANQVIGNNLNRVGKTLWTENKEGSNVEVRELNSERSEADYILTQISMFKHNYEYEYKDIAILVRTTTITKFMEEALLMYNIPYRLIGGRKFYERKEIKDFLAYLHIITNSNDDLNLLRVINVPKRGIGETAIATLKNACVTKGYSLHDGLIHLDELNLKDSMYKKFLPFAALISDFNNKKDGPMNAFIDHVYNEVGFDMMYDIDKEEDAARLENLKELKRSIKEFNKLNPTLTLSDYLQSVTLMTSEDETDSDRDMVTIATVHGVKGLEFKCVFVMGLEEGIFPSSRIKNEAKEQEEERRIFYVAVTRAKERLYLTHATYRYRFGKTNYQIPSCYLKEIKIKKETPKIALEKQYKPKFDFANVYRETPDFAKKKEIKATSEKDLSIFKIGQRVVHARFGEGKIISIAGENADIEYDIIGIKKFNLRLAPIEPVN